MIQVDENTRVRMDDPLQYVIEVNYGNKENWRPVAYVANVDGLSAHVERIVVGRAVDLARKQAKEKYASTNLSMIFSTLPKKGKVK